MRHLFGLLIGIPLAPFLFVGTAWSVARIPREALDLDLFDRTGPILVLALCAVVFAILVAGRISPLTSFLVSLPFLIVGTVGILAPSALEDLPFVSVDNEIGLGGMTLGRTGFGLVLGIIAAMPMMVGSRWKRWRDRMPTVATHLAAGYPQQGAFGYPPGAPGQPRVPAAPGIPAPPGPAPVPGTPISGSPGATPPGSPGPIRPTVAVPEAPLGSLPPRHRPPSSPHHALPEEPLPEEPDDPKP